MENDDKKIVEIKPLRVEVTGLLRMEEFIKQRLNMEIALALDKLILRKIDESISRSDNSDNHG
jgi:hypothetical protein